MYPIRMGSGYGWLVVGALSALGCQKFRDGSECPSGTSFKRIELYSPPATKEICVDGEGKPHGPYRVWADKDPLWSGTCEHGVAEGKWTVFGPTGESQRIRELSAGVIHGEVTVYSGGQVLRHGRCTKGVATGVWENPRGNKTGTYDETGKLVSGSDVASGECSLAVKCGAGE